MHRAYQPHTPTNNKLLRNRWDDSDYQFHKKMVETAVAVVDDKPPKEYIHLQLKLKALQIKNERLAKVKREDQILMEKLSDIRRKSSIVDHWNKYEPKSLNKVKRKNRLSLISNDNQAILKRIKEKSSFYEQSELNKHHKSHQKYLENITKYPKDLSKKNSSKLKFSSKEEIASEERKKASEAEEDDSKSTVEEQDTKETSAENEVEEGSQKEESEDAE